MKRTVVALSLMGLMVLPGFGQDKEADRVEAAGTVISEIMNLPDDIPQDVIDKADCVVVLPSVLKAAFIVGGSYGLSKAQALASSWAARLRILCSC